MDFLKGRIRMTSCKICLIETQRLALRPFKLQDASFVLKLLNTPSWLRYIGDRHVYTQHDAQNYIRTRLISSYHQWGYSMFRVSLKESDVPIGMCGLVNRPNLTYPDLGFALLPEFEKQGYAFESATAILKAAFERWQLTQIWAITDLENQASIRLLKKLGFGFLRLTIWEETGESLNLFTINLSQHFSEDPEIP